MAELDNCPPCPECKSETERVPSKPFMKIWEPLTLEHINVEGEEPLTFETEKSLRDYCRKHKLQSGALL